ncbi:MAG: hypothetical protein GYA24_03275 [Candidatus Lokiarchaeota archaeon]|nr:hypothetical protein [Candidatus Lokiarchaeota archaeon]
MAKKSPKSARAIHNRIQAARSRVCPASCFDDCMKCQKLSDELNKPVNYH